jgi:PAS domain S-box-containing protein
MHGTSLDGIARASSGLILVGELQPLTSEETAETGDLVRGSHELDEIPMTHPESHRHSLSARVMRLPPAAHYTIAVAAPVLAALIRNLLDPIWGRALPFITFFPAVMLTAWLGGLWPGIVSTLVAAFLADVFWLAPVHSLAIGNAGDFMGLMIFASTGGLVSALNENWRRAAAALARSEEQLSVTLASIADAVITTDNRGSVTSLNAVAETLTGWTNAEAVGRELEDVFVIIDENTRAPVEHPTHRVLRNGAILAIADHTVLVSKSGREIPIDDSAAPIRSGDGTPTGMVVVFRDVTEQRRARRDIEAKERIARELAAIVESSDDAIVGKSLNGTIRSWNQGAERMFGYTRAEVVGQSIRMIVPDDRIPEEEAVISAIGQGESVAHLETVRRRKDGTLVPVFLSVSPILAPDGTVIGASKIARDISERKRAEEAQRSAYEEARRANRLKDEFLATLSHELRTPLNAIFGYARMLHSGTLPPDKERRAVAVIERNATALNKMVEDVLDVSRIISGKTRLHVQPVTLSSVVEQAVATVRPTADAKGVRLQFICDGKLDPMSGDPDRLQQVIWNLLSNAIKFTPRDGLVQITLQLANADVEIVVSDTGRGIAPEFLPHVFERFRQADSGLTREVGGLGLGLAIVRHLVELHGGTIHAASEGEGKGATFRVRLPPAARPSVSFEAALGFSRPERRRDAPPAARLDGVRVVAVDDEEDTLTLVRLILETAGAQVRTARSADEALDALRRGDPHVLIADIGMPVMDGFELIQRVRQSPDRIRDVPAAALTAYTRSEDRTRALHSGFHTYLAKPIDPDELVAAIGRLARQVAVH